jgi:predicted SprT family Zn-dependent metalloprotease
MNTLDDLGQLTRKLLAKTYTFTIHGTTYNVNPYLDLDYTFQFDNAKRRLGCCHYTQRMITLSKPLALNNLDKIEGKLTDTILHEIAHALSYHTFGRRAKGHGDIWQSVAKQIGCNAERCYSSDEIDKVESKYSLTCPTCGRVATRHRLPKDGIACGKCCKEYSDGKYDSTHEFIVKQNY